MRAQRAHNAKRFSEPFGTSFTQFLSMMSVIWFRYIMSIASLVDRPIFMWF